MSLNDKSSSSEENDEISKEKNTPKGKIDLKDLRLKNPNRLIFGHLNINSLRNKFELLCHQIKGNVDILLISETKLDNSFPAGQFLIDGYSVPYRLDRNIHGGGIMLYIREDIPYKIVP